jgi:hypothetical protein
MLIPLRSPVALPALGLVAALAWPREAHADVSHMVSPALSFGVSFGERTSFSLGLDVRYAVLPEGAGCSATPWGFGTFGQAALLIGSGGVAGRFAAGLHGGGGPPVPALQPGAEIGWTYRTAYPATRERPAIPGWHGLHLGIMSWFFLAEELTVRGAIPLGRKGAHPEMTVALGGRFPPPYGLGGFCISGRPLRDGDRMVLPPVLVGQTRFAGDATLDLATRSALSEAWLDDARTECASIPAFLALARDLASVGAPDALVARALVAAEEEALHTLLCSAVASRTSGTLAAPVLLLPPPAQDGSVDDALVRLAVESYRDGCVGEGAAAEGARRALVGAEDPLARAALSRIAEDEQRHADLAWDVLRFCVERGGRAVANAVEIEASASAYEGARSREPDADEGALRAHGRLDGQTMMGAWGERREAAMKRLAAWA